MIICVLEDDSVLAYEDTCFFTCNTSYELTGSDTRTCQSNGNGVIICVLEDDSVPAYEDTCFFTCNTSYELTGSDTRTCQSNGTWSGSEDVCRRI